MSLTLDCERCTVLIIDSGRSDEELDKTQAPGNFCAENEMQLNCRNIKSNSIGKNEKNI